MASTATKRFIQGAIDGAKKLDIALPFSRLHRRDRLELRTALEEITKRA